MSETETVERTYYIVCMSHLGEGCSRYEDIRFITQSEDTADKVFDALKEHWEAAVDHLIGPSELCVMKEVLLPDTESIEAWYNGLPTTTYKVDKIRLNTYFHEGLVNYREGEHARVPLSDTIAVVLGDHERGPPRTPTTPWECRCA